MAMTKAQQRLWDEGVNLSSEAADLRSRADSWLGRMEAEGMVAIDENGNVTVNSDPPGEEQGNLNGRTNDDLQGAILAFVGIKGAYQQADPSDNSMILADRVLRLANAKG